LDTLYIASDIQTCIIFAIFISSRAVLTPMALFTKIMIGKAIYSQNNFKWLGLQLS